MPNFLNSENVDKRGQIIYTSAHRDSDGNPTTRVSVMGTKVEEQQTQADATDGVITFSGLIEYIGIYNRDKTNDGKFTVNGIGLTIPKDESAEFHIGGKIGNTVKVTGSTSYIITRYK